MAFVFATLLWSVLAAVALIALVGLMPLRIDLAMCKGDTWRYRVALRPLAGFGPRINLRHGDRGPKAKPKKPANGLPKGHRRTRRDPIRSWRAAQHLLVRVLQCVHIDRADIDVRFGLGDPAETGHAFGLVAPLVYGAPIAPGFRLHVEPVFDAATFAGQADVRLSFVPFRLLGPLTRFGWSVFGGRS